MPAIIRARHWSRALELAKHAAVADCACNMRGRGRKVVDCESCLAVLVAHAMTEASNPVELKQLGERVN